MFLSDIFIFHIFGKHSSFENLKFFAKYSLLQAPTKHENRLAGSGGDSRARATAAYGQNTAFMANLGPLSAPMATWNGHSRSENWFQQVGSAKKEGLQ